MITTEGWTHLLHPDKMLYDQLGFHNEISKIMKKHFCFLVCTASPANEVHTLIIQPSAKWMSQTPNLHVGPVN